MKNHSFPYLIAASTLTLSLLGAIPASVQAHETEQLTIERIHSSPALQGAAPNSLKVSPDGKRVTFLQGKSTDFDRYDLWQYEVATGKTSILFDSDDLHSGPEILSDEEKARRERQRVFGTGIIEYFWSADGKSLLFPLAGDAYVYKLGEENAKQLLKTEAFETDIRFSPKGNYISYIRDQNLYIMDVKTGEEQQLTSDGGGPIKYGMAEFVAQEEMGRLTGYWWAPDESKIAFTKVDESPVDEITRTEIYAESIDLIKQRYPSTGTNNVHVELAVMKLKNKEVDWVDLGDNKDIYLARVNWKKDSRGLTYQWQNRSQQKLELRLYDSKNKKLSLLVEESSDTWVNLNDDLHFLKDKKHFIWASERSGFKHLYLYRNDGRLVRQLTSGDWIVDEIEAIDEKKKIIYFTGRKDTPIESHLYSVSYAKPKALDQDSTTRVSQRSGFHDIVFSDDAAVYIDRFSTANTPPQVSLHNNLGDQLTWLEENAINESHPLHPYQEQWVAPKFGTIKTNDGATLHYRLYTPKKINGKHPAIVFQYGGPHAQLVTNRWAGNRGLLLQHWVDKGYVVFTVDNRGSYNRGKAFEDPIFKNMGDIEVQDQVAGVKFLHSLPYVDKERIGIHGHSYGGYMTLMAMFKAGEYFKAGVAGAPVTDWSLYDTHYTERYMGHPEHNAEGYEGSSVFPYAKDLTGALLIYHGMADDNVLFKNSTKLYKHLQDLAIPFETMDYPGKKHSIRGKQTGIHLYHTITNFFDRNLAD
ncbi:S9 family peptidase [Alteromonadaceae bacterium M269]|nr:S9 family peptidase [Alteromonadaceae bacterium M269]